MNFILAALDRLREHWLLRDLYPYEEVFTLRSEFRKRTVLRWRHEGKRTLH